MFSVSESFSWGTYFTFPLVPVEFIFDLKLVFLCSHLGRDRADIAAMKKCKKQKDFLLRSNKQELDDILLTEKKKKMVILLKYLKSLFNTGFKEEKETL